MLALLLHIVLCEDIYDAKVINFALVYRGETAFCHFVELFWKGFDDGLTSTKCIAINGIII